MKWIFLILFLTGCTPALMNIETSCPNSIAYPPPISKNIYIEIDENTQKTNYGGERLLRNYAECRKSIHNYNKER